MTFDKQSTLTRLEHVKILVSTRFVEQTYKIQTAEENWAYLRVVKYSRDLVAAPRAFN